MVHRMPKTGDFLWNTGYRQTAWDRRVIEAVLTGRLILLTEVPSPLEGPPHDPVLRSQTSQLTQSWVVEVFQSLS